MDGMLFLLYAPFISAAASFIGWLIAIIIQDSKSTKTYSIPKSTSSSKPTSSCGSTLYRGCGNPSSLYDYDYSNYGYNSRSSLESEMRAHNARMEQLMREQNKIMIDNECRRISESNQRSLADMFDTRLTNIFRNPWEGIL